MKKKKKKKPAKDGEDEFAAKLAALDIDKEGADEAVPLQEGDMYVDVLIPFCRLANSETRTWIAWWTEATRGEFWKAY